jgi:hypothetical protein
MIQPEATSSSTRMIIWLYMCTILIFIKIFKLHVHFCTFV